MRPDYFLRRHWPWPYRVAIVVEWAGPDVVDLAPDDRLVEHRRVNLIHADPAANETEANRDE